MLGMEMVPRFGAIMYYRPIPRLPKKQAINVANLINMKLAKMTKHGLTSESNYFFLAV